MINKIMGSLKYVIVFGIALISLVSCEDDFDKIGTGLVDNDSFKVADATYDVVAKNVNVEKALVTNLEKIIPQSSGAFTGGRNLGVLKTDKFGTLYASLISQLGLPTNVDFGLNPVIDTVILDIPYYFTISTENDKRKITLDSIYGNKSNGYNLKVSRLTTFLNSLDPNDPSKNKRYYSNEDYSTSDIFYEDYFEPNANDTVLIVKRSFFSGNEKYDTIPNQEVRVNPTSALKPSIKLPLDKKLIEKIFITEASENNYSSSDNFKNYFRGLKIDALPSNVLEQGNIMYLKSKDATLTIYYTNDVLTKESDVNKDLNEDGDQDDEVLVKTKQALSFLFSNIIQASTYTRDYSGSEVENAINSQTDEGSEYLYVQGSAGTEVEISDMLNQEALDSLRNQNLLINGAILDFYVKDSIDGIKLPNRLFLYKKESHSIIKDTYSEFGFSRGIDGFLIRDKENTRYRFSITDYISDVLKNGDDFSKLETLVLKPIHYTDFINPNAYDTIVKDYSWDVKGVVLHGNKSPEQEKKIKLKLYYSKN